MPKAKPGFTYKCNDPHWYERSKSEAMDGLSTGKEQVTVHGKRHFGQTVYRQAGRFYLLDRGDHPWFNTPEEAIAEAERRVSKGE